MFGASGMATLVLDIIFSSLLGALNWCSTAEMAVLGASAIPRKLRRGLSGFFRLRPASTLTCWWPGQSAGSARLHSRPAPVDRRGDSETWVERQSRLRLFPSPGNLPLCIPGIHKPADGA